MKPVIYNERLIPQTADCVGNKAFNLFKINQIVKVPKFVVLDSGEMINVLKAKENQILNNEIRVKWLNKLNLSYYMEYFQSAVTQMTISDEWIQEVYRCLEYEGIKEPYAVRASSIYEDAAGHSAPGIFQTVLNVRKEGLEDAIKKCWSSNFSLKTAYYFGNYLENFDDIRSGVIIQSMQYGEYAGIMFTVDPVTGEKKFVIEAAEKSSEQLTDGKISGERFLVEYENKDLIIGIPRYISNLVCEAKKLLELFHKDIDIEWVSTQDMIYIIQVRPVSAIQGIKNKVSGIYQIFQLSDMNIQGASIETMLRRWRGKKQHFNRACEETGIKYLKWFFVKNYNKGLREDVLENIKHISAEYVTLAVNTILTDIVVPKEKIIEELEKYCIKGEENYIVSIRELPINEVSVISSVIQDGNIYLEIIDGIMKGLKSGEQNSSKYVINSTTGEIIEKQEIHNEDCYGISFPSGEIKLEKNSISEYQKYEACFVEIARNTKILFDKGQIGAIEWWICDRCVYAADISLDKNGINIVQEKSVKRVSNGNIEGKVYLLSAQKRKELEELSYGQAISVDTFNSNVYFQEMYQILREEIQAMKDSGKVVLGLEYPILSVAPLLDFVDGVVFRNASILCHLAIILRERGIPAVSLGKEFDCIKHGQRIMLEE